MLCLLIAHGIFLRQEASQSRRAIMKSPRPLQTHLVRAPSGQSGTRLSPAPSRVCEAFAHRRRVRLKLRPARACTEPPGQLVSFLTTTTARCRLPYLAHFPLRTSLASRHPHEHRTASSLSLVLCNNSSFHCTWASRHSFRHPSLTYLPFFVPGDLDTPDASTTLILPPLAPGQQPYYTFYLSAWLLDACARHGSHLIPPNHLVFFTAKLRSQLPLPRAFLTTTTYDKRIQ